MATFEVRKRIVREIVYIVDAPTRREAVALANDAGEVPQSLIPGLRFENDYIVRETWYVNGSHHDDPEA